MPELDFKFSSPKFTGDSIAGILQGARSIERAGAAKGAGYAAAGAALGQGLAAAAQNVEAKRAEEQKLKLVQEQQKAAIALADIVTDPNNFYDETVYGYVDSVTDPSLLRIIQRAQQRADAQTQLALKGFGGGTGIMGHAEAASAAGIQARAQAVDEVAQYYVKLGETDQVAHDNATTLFGKRTRSIVRPERRQAIIDAKNRLMAMGLMDASELRVLIDGMDSNGHFSVSAANDQDAIRAKDMFGPSAAATLKMQRESAAQGRADQFREERTRTLAADAEIAERLSGDEITVPSGPAGVPVPTGMSLPKGGIRVSLASLRTGVGEQLLTIANLTETDPATKDGIVAAMTQQTPMQMLGNQEMNAIRSKLKGPGKDFSDAEVRRWQIDNRIFADRDDPALHQYADERVKAIKEQYTDAFPQHPGGATAALKGSAGIQLKGVIDNIQANLARGPEPMSLGALNTVGTAGLDRLKHELQDVTGIADHLQHVQLSLTDDGSIVVVASEDEFSSPADRAEVEEAVTAVVNQPTVRDEIILRSWQGARLDLNRTGVNNAVAHLKGTQLWAQMSGTAGRTLLPSSQRPTSVHSGQPQAPTGAAAILGSLGIQLGAGSAPNPPASEAPGSVTQPPPPVPAALPRPSPPVAPPPAEPPSAPSVPAGVPAPMPAAVPARAQPASRNPQPQGVEFEGLGGRTRDPSWVKGRPPTLPARKSSQLTGDSLAARFLKNMMAGAPKKARYTDNSEKDVHLRTEIARLEGRLEQESGQAQRAIGSLKDFLEGGKIDYRKKVKLRERVEKEQGEARAALNRVLAWKKKYPVRRN